MAFTQAQLEAIEEAIGSGELTVRYNGREITYRSMADLREAREMIKQSLAVQAQTTSNAPPTLGGRAFSLARFNGE